MSTVTNRCGGSFFLPASNRVPSSPPSVLDVERMIAEAIAAGRIHRVPLGESGLTAASKGDTGNDRIPANLEGDDQ